MMDLMLVFPDPLLPISSTWEGKKRKNQLPENTKAPPVTAPLTRLLFFSTFLSPDSSERRAPFQVPGIRRPAKSEKQPGQPRVSTAGEKPDSRVLLLSIRPEEKVVPSGAKNQGRVGVGGSGKTVTRGKPLPCDLKIQREKAEPLSAPPARRDGCETSSSDMANPSLRQQLCEPPVTGRSNESTTGPSAPGQPPFVKCSRGRRSLDSRPRSATATAARISGQNRENRTVRSPASEHPSQGSSGPARPGPGSKHCSFRGGSARSPLPEQTGEGPAAACPERRTERTGTDCVSLHLQKQPGSKVQPSR